MGSRSQNRASNSEPFPTIMDPATLEDPLDGDDNDVMGGAPLDMADDSPDEVFGGNVMSVVSKMEEGLADEEGQEDISSQGNYSYGSWGPQPSSHHMEDEEEYDDEENENDDGQDRENDDSEMEDRTADVNRLDDHITKIMGFLDRSTDDEHEDDDDECDDESGDDGEFWEEDYAWGDDPSCPFHHPSFHAADDGDLDAMLFDPIYPPYDDGIDASDDDGLGGLPATHAPHLSASFWTDDSYDIMPTAPAVQVHMDPPSIVATMIQQVAAFYQAVEGGAPDANIPFPTFLTNTIHTIGPRNHTLTEFLDHWVQHNRTPRDTSRGRYPLPGAADSLEKNTEDLSINYADLEGDRCDFQGINWEEMGVSRRLARERRDLTYSNYVNLRDSDRWEPHFPDYQPPVKSNFFRFRSMDIKRDIHLSHFQLRHVFAATSRSRVFYPAVGTVQQFNPVSGDTRAVLKLIDTPSSQISTLAASHGFLVAGGFGGEYLIRRLDTGEPDSYTCSGGIITTSMSGITNHVAIYQPRSSSGPVAAFASNDNRIRVMDIGTEKWLSDETYDFAPNCSAISPDGRLRVVVGDSVDVLVTAADHAQPNRPADVIHRLSGHRDYGFACDWADDGWTFATGFQDKTVRVWDARRLHEAHTGRGAPVCTIRSDLAGARCLRFSPIGSGPRVLVAAEEADMISVIDARTFKSKQTFDVFGELGGIDFADGGRELMVLCCDPARGGVLHFERCAAAEAEAASAAAELVGAWEEEGIYIPPHSQYGGGSGRKGKARRSSGSSASGSASAWAAAAGLDWKPSVFTEEKRVKGGMARWRKRMAASVEVGLF